MGQDRRDAIGRDEAPALKRWPNAARKLPPAGETWMRADIDLDHGALNTFRRSGVIEKHSRNDDSDNDAWIWETRPGIVEWVEKHVSENTTPCGHATGVRTITAGEEYTCTCEDCDCRMDRETAEEVVA